MMMMMANMFNNNINNINIQKKITTRLTMTRTPDHLETVLLEVLRTTVKSEAIFNQLSRPLVNYLLYSSK